MYLCNGPIPALSLPHFPALVVAGQPGHHPQSRVLFCTPGVVPVTPSFLSCGTIYKTFLLPAQAVAHQQHHVGVPCLL